MAKTKALISCAITGQLICVFVFAYANCWFSYAKAHILLHSQSCLVVERQTPNLEVLGLIPAQGSVLEKDTLTPQSTG